MLRYSALKRHQAQVIIIIGLKGEKQSWYFLLFTNREFKSQRICLVLRNANLNPSEHLSVLQWLPLKRFLERGGFWSEGIGRCQEFEWLTSVRGPTTDGTCLKCRINPADLTEMFCSVHESTVSLFSLAMKRVVANYAGHVTRWFAVCEVGQKRKYIFSRRPLVS